MKKVFLVLALALATVLAPPFILGQGLFVHGHVIGEDGKPLIGGDILLVNKDNGQKLTMKTDKKGDFVHIGVAPGSYDMTLTKDAKVLYTKGVSLHNEDETLDINLPKNLAEQQQQSLNQLTPEQRKQYEAQRRAGETEQAKIKNLNQMMADAKAAEDGGNYDQAISIYKQATTADPTRDLLWARLGGAYLNAGNKAFASDRTAANEDYTQSAQAYKKAIAIKGSEAAYHNNLGQALAKLGRTDEAMNEYAAAASIDPSNAGQYYFNLGALLTNAATRMADDKERNHALDEANAAFDKAIAAEPNRAEAYYQKAVNLLNRATVGKDNRVVAPPGTAEALNTYLKLAPSGPHAAEAKELLTSIGAKVETSYQKKK